MDFYQLECFVHAYEHESFSQAAADMFLAQTSFAYRISSLEKELGCALFVRDKRGAAPTDAAHAMYRDALEALRIRKRMMEHALEASGANGSSVHVGFNRYPNIDSFFSAVGAFKAEHPQAGVELDLSYVCDIEADIENANHDVVFYFDYGEKIPPSLEFRRLGSSPYYAVFGEGHPLAGRDSIVLDDLAGLTYAVPRQYLNTPIQVPSSDVLRKHGIAVDATAQDNESLLLWVKTLQGFSVYPVSRPGAVPGYSHVPIADLEPLGHGLLYSRKRVSPQAREFIEFVSRYMALGR